MAVEAKLGLTRDHLECSATSSRLTNCPGLGGASPYQQSVNETFLPSSGIHRAGEVGSWAEPAQYEVIRIGDIFVRWKRDPSHVVKSVSAPLVGLTQGTPRGIWKSHNSDTWDVIKFYVEGITQCVRLPAETRARLFTKPLPDLKEVTFIVRQ